MEDPPLYGRGMLGENPRDYLQPGMLGGQSAAPGLLAALGLTGPSFAERMAQRPMPPPGQLWGNIGPDDPLIGFAMSTGRVPGRLPMDAASRLARAREQGFTVDAFKGAYPFDASQTPAFNWRGEMVRPGRYEELRYFDSPDNPYAGFFSDSVDVANRFARAFGSDIGGGSAAVYPVRLRLERPLEMNLRGRPAADVQFGPYGNRVRAAFSENPRIDSVILRNTADEGTVFIPRTPQQIRSVHAAFDPAGATSPDMLRAILPWAIPAGGAGLLGWGGGE